MFFYDNVKGILQTQRIKEAWSLSIITTHAKPPAVK